MTKSNHHTYSRSELNQTGIYEITHISVPQYVYVGSASKSDRVKYRDIGFLQRWRNHLGQLRRKCHFNIFLQRVVNKYGIDGIRFKIIEVCDPSICIERENYHLEEYKKKYALYNMQTATATGTGYFHSEDTKRKIGQGRKKKKVYQFSLEKVLIAEYECLYHVLKKFKSGSSTIWRCLNNKQNTSYGFIWSYNKKIA